MLTDLPKCGFESELLVTFLPSKGVVVTRHALVLLPNTKALSLSLSLSLPLSLSLSVCLCLSLSLSLSLCLSLSLSLCVEHSSFFAGPGKRRESTTLKFRTAEP